jgi:hypothetical protein
MAIATFFFVCGIVMGVSASLAWLEGKYARQATDAALKAEELKKKLGALDHHTRHTEKFCVGLLNQIMEEAQRKAS